MVSPQNFLNFNFVFNGPSYFVRNWGLTSVVATAARQLHDHQPKTALLLPVDLCRAVRTELPARPKIHHVPAPRFPTPDDPHYFLSAAQRRSGGISSYKIPITDIGVQPAPSLFVSDDRWMFWARRHPTATRSCVPQLRELVESSETQRDIPNNEHCCCDCNDASGEGNTGMDIQDMYFLGQRGMKLFVPPGNQVLDRPSISCS